MYQGCSESFETLNILQSESQEMCAIFSVADFEYPAGCCSTAEQNIFLHVHRGCLNGMVW